MTQDDRMETITDPEQIRATDEPDERGDFPCCTTPAPASGAGLGVCGYALTDSEGDEYPCDATATGYRWYQDVEHEDLLDVACEFHRNAGGDRMAALVAEVRRKSALAADSHARAEVAEAEVVTLRAKVAAVQALADQWADRKRSDGMSGNAWIGITLAGVAADLRAALATTGEGE